MLMRSINSLDCCHRVHAGNRKTKAPEILHPSCSFYIPAAIVS